MACIARSVIAERRTMCGEGENVLLDRVREVEQAHHLRHPGEGDPIPAGGVGLVGDLAGLEEDLPFDGRARIDDHYLLVQILSDTCSSRYCQTTAST
jgi:hypothetical protein